MEFQTDKKDGEFSNKSDTTEWSVAIDLKLNMRSSTDRGRLGAERKSALLQDLKEESRHAPVSLYVQMSIPDSQGEGNAPSSPVVSRFLIHDGEVKPLPVPRIKDPAALTADLLVSAGNDGESRHLGLLVFSHGFGSHGLGSDQGKISLAEFNTSIARALSELKQDKLDLLAFDGCSMAQVDTLSKVANLTHNLVASPEYMTCQSERSCGMDLNLWMSQLMKDPSMNGERLAEQAVDNAEAAYKNIGAGVASPALIHFRLDQNYADFSQSFDQFSSELEKSLSVYSNKKELQNIADTTPEYERFYSLDPPYPSPKDLKVFVDQVQQEIKSGKLRDPEGRLESSAERLRLAQRKMTESYFGAPQYTVLDPAPAPNEIPKLPVRARVPYNQLGGLSIALPDEEQVKDAGKSSVSWSQYVNNETVSELSAWRHFLIALRS